MALCMMALRFGCALLGGAPLGGTLLGGAALCLVVLRFGGALHDGATLWLRSVLGCFSPLLYSFAALLLLFAHSCARVLKIVPAYATGCECLGGEAAVNIKRHARHHQ